MLSMRNKFSGHQELSPTPARLFGMEEHEVYACSRKLFLVNRISKVLVTGDHVAWVIFWVSYQRAKMTYEGPHAHISVRPIRECRNGRSFLLLVDLRAVCRNGKLVRS